MFRDRVARVESLCPPGTWVQTPQRQIIMLSQVMVRRMTDEQAQRSVTSNGAQARVSEGGDENFGSEFRALKLELGPT